MQIELIENPLILPALDAQTSTFALHDDQVNSCALPGCSLNDEMKSTEEQMRLILSWRAVLQEIGSGEQGASQW